MYILVILITAMVVMIWAVGGLVFVNDSDALQGSKFAVAIRFFLAGPVVWATLVAMLIVIASEREI
jgi:hypothetical protein